MPCMSYHAAKLSSKTPQELRDSDWKKTIQKGMVCPFCSSISADDFFQMLTDGKLLLPVHSVFEIRIGGQPFNFKHLTDLEQLKFVALLNAHRVNFDTPGTFHCLPFFISATPGLPAFPHSYSLRESHAIPSAN